MRILELDLEKSKQRTFMLVSPTAPNRCDYLEFHCRELGRGRRTNPLSSMDVEMESGGGLVADLPAKA